MGAVVTVLLYSRQFSAPLEQIAEVLGSIQRICAAARRVYEMQDAPEEEPIEGHLPEEIKGDVDFENVNFSYDPETPLIRDFTVKVKHGQKVAIVGPTGAGKTTLVNLLMRFYDIQSGKITIDGHDIAAVSREDVRGLFGMVLQDTWLFGGTVADNVAYGKPKATREEIVTACEYLRAHPEVPHRALAVCFTPDEEVGKGTDHFDPEKFLARAAYTVDGGELGEIEYENFNAAAVTLTVEGVNIHPGSAKNKMKNAILLANQFISLLPAAEAPAHTEGYEGFYHVTDLAGNESQVVLHAIIRDHDLEKFNARKAFVERLTAYLNDQWGQGTFRLDMKDSYYNMKEKIRPHMELIENAKAAMEAVGVEPVIVPIRGGTDGARLSWERDIPCPNLCTGGANFHGVHEFIPVPSMEKMVQVLVELVKA